MGLEEGDYLISEFSLEKTKSEKNSMAFLKGSLEIIISLQLDKKEKLVQIF